MITYSKLLTGEFIDRLGAMIRDVNTGLAHNGNSIGIQASRFRSRTEHLKVFTGHALAISMLARVFRATSKVIRALLLTAYSRALIKLSPSIDATAIFAAARQLFWVIRELQAVAKEESAQNSASIVMVIRMS